jgi:outer membrane protein insertion porin family
VNPTEGFILRLSNDVAGLGGTVRNFRNQLKAAQYYSPFKDMILSLEGRAGHILGMGQDVEVPDRYFLGGDSLRGFATSGAGPRDKVTKDSLGGEWVYNGSIQASFPLGFPEELAVSGKLFTDFGSLGSVNPSDSNVLDSASLRLSAGAGIGWVSPLGPINIDFGFPLLKESLDETELMRLNFGTRF